MRSSCRSSQPTVLRIAAFLLFALFVQSGTVLAGPFKPSLVGDTVLVSHDFPSFGTHVSGMVTPDGMSVVPLPYLVTAGTADQVYLLGNSQEPLYIIDIEASSVLIDFRYLAHFSAADFNGLVVSDLDWLDHPDARLVGVTIDTDIPGWTDSRLDYGDHFVSFNWQDLPIPYNSTFPEDTPYRFNAYLEVADPPETVPDAGSSLLLFGIGLAGLGAWRKRCR